MRWLHPAWFILFAEYSCPIQGEDCGLAGRGLYHGVFPEPRPCFGTILENKRVLVDCLPGTVKNEHNRVELNFGCTAAHTQESLKKTFDMIREQQNFAYSRGVMSWILALEACQSSTSNATRDFRIELQESRDDCGVNVIQNCSAQLELSVDFMLSENEQGKAAQFMMVKFRPKSRNIAVPGAVAKWRNLWVLLLVLVWVWNQ